MNWMSFFGLPYVLLNGKVDITHKNMLKKTAISTLIFSVVFALMAALIVPAYADDDNGKGKGNDDEFKLAKEVKAIGSMLEVHVTDRGNVLVRGAKVTAISGNTISAATTWGSASMTWNIVTDSNTEFVRRGGKSSISEISVGDLVSFQGMLQTGVASPLTVQAKIVKNWTVLKPAPAPMTLEGKIKTPPAASSTPTTMVATFKDRDYTVNIAADTSVLNVFWLRIPLTSLKAGDNVRIYGLVNSASSTIDATVIRDTSVR